MGLGKPCQQHEDHCGHGTGLNHRTLRQTPRGFRRPRQQQFYQQQHDSQTQRPLESFNPRAHGGRGETHGFHGGDAPFVQRGHGPRGLQRQVEPVGRFGQTLQQRFVQQRFDRVAVFILEEDRVAIGIAGLEQFAARGAHPHREQVDPGCGQTSCGRLGQLFMILAVGDEDHRLAGAGIRAEGLNRFIQSSRQCRALFGNDVRVQRGHVLTECLAIQSKRTLEKGRARKCDQADAV